MALSSSGRPLGWLVGWLALNLRGEAANARESFDLGFFSSQSQTDLSAIGQMLRRSEFKLISVSTVLWSRVFI